MVLAIMKLMLMRQLRLFTLENGHAAAFRRPIFFQGLASVLADRSPHKTSASLRKLNPPTMQAALLPVSCELIEIEGLPVLNKAMPCFWSTHKLPVILLSLTR